MPVIRKKLTVNLDAHSIGLFGDGDFREDDGTEGNECCEERRFHDSHATERNRPRSTPAV
jgi:hypothetical protein